MSPSTSPRRDRGALSVAALLAIATLVGFVGRHDFWVGSVFIALRLPLVGMALAAFLLARRLRVSKLPIRLIGAAALALLASWGVDVARARAPAANPGGKQIKVLTANLLFVNTQSTRVIKRLAASDADVVTLQEVTPLHQRAIGPALKKLYPHQHWAAASGAFGSAILSKFPLKKRREHFDGSQRFAQCASVRADRTLRVCSVHLTSPAEAFPVRASPAFVLELDAVAHARARQVVALLKEEVEAASARDEPVVLAGDFNTLEIEPLHQLLAQRLVDTYRKTSWKLGGTWPHRLGASRRSSAVARIDYIFASDTLGVDESRVLAPAGSDHAPLLTTLRLTR